MENKKRISILLATYNSGKYLREQLDSLFLQSNQDWILVVRDDCSVDNTMEILMEYKERYPGRIDIIDNKGKSLHAYGNFLEILSDVESDYYMFCDHDDVWLPDKIEISMARMVEIEKKDVPVIVHTDMKVVDQNLKVIHDSFWHFSRLLPERTSFKELVLCNSVNGCTMLFNHKAREVSMPHKEHATMHDMLVAQSVAANEGIIVSVDIATVMYRQHINNVVGARERDKMFYYKKMRNPLKLLERNYHDWNLSRQIKPYSLISYWWTKLEILFWKIKKYY